MRIVARPPGTTTGRRVAWLAALVAILLATAVPAHAATAAAPGSDRSISGTVTIDGEPAADGATLTAEAVTEDDVAPVECGQAAVTDGGAFTMPIADACRAGVAMRLRLVDPALEAKDLIEAPADTTADVLVRFESPQPAGDGAEITAAIAGAQAAPAEPLIKDTELVILLALIAGSAVVLLAYVSHQWVNVAKTSASIKPARGASNHEVTMAQARLEQMGTLSMVVPKVLIEGMVLAMAVVAIVVLGASAKLTSEGLVSVLAAIVGYAAGRSSIPPTR